MLASLCRHGYFAALATLLAGCGPAVGSAIVHPTTEAVDVRTRGGLPTPLVAGRDCRDHAAAYTYERSTHRLQWDFCIRGEKGARVLVGEEIRRAEAAIGALRVIAGEHRCWPDATEIIVATRGGKAETFHNDACGTPAPFVDEGSVSALLHVFMELAEA
jgi:hypothetical protein